MKNITHSWFRTKGPNSFTVDHRYLHLHHVPRCPARERVRHSITLGLELLGIQCDVENRKHYNDVKGWICSSVELGQGGYKKEEAEDRMTGLGGMNGG